MMSDLWVLIGWLYIVDRQFIISWIILPWTGTYRPSITWSYVPFPVV